MARISDHYKAAGKAAGMAADDVVLVANANSLENFTLWIARIIDDGIVDAFSDDAMSSDAHTDWFNDYCDQCMVSRARGSVDHIPERSPFVREIASEIYSDIRATKTTA